MGEDDGVRKSRPQGQGKREWKLQSKTRESMIFNESLKTANLLDLLDSICYIWPWRLSGFLSIFVRGKKEGGRDERGNLDVSTTKARLRF